MHVRVLAAIKPTQLTDPSGLSSVGLDLRNPNNLLFGGGVSSCGDKSRVRSLASLVHCKEQAARGKIKCANPTGNTGIILEMVKEDVCVRADVRVRVRARA
jgi:hypothetical protein